MLLRGWETPVPTIGQGERDNTKDAEDLLNQKTIEILETHKPKPLPEELVRELKKVEKTWFERVGLKHEYPKREEK